MRFHMHTLKSEAVVLPHPPMFAVLFTITFHLWLKIDVWLLGDPIMNDLYMEQLVPAGWIKGSWSVFGFTWSC